MAKRNKAFLVWVTLFVALGIVFYFTTKRWQPESPVVPASAAKKQ